ncbi:restriction endonuclease subunit S [Deferrisoma palaeochoriense]
MEWPRVPIEQVAELNPKVGQWDRLAESDPVTFVPMQAVSEDTASIESPAVRPLSEVRRGFSHFQERDVLFAKITPCMENGKVAIARNLVNRVGYGSTEFHVLRAGPALLPEYLYYFLRQPSFRLAAKQQMRGGAGQQRVPELFLRKEMIPLPPLSEQRRIVEILDQADRLRRLRAEADAIAERILPALFIKMFGDPATNPMGWPLRPLGELCDVVSGATPKTNVPEYWGGGIAWATPKDLSGLDDWVLESTERTLTEDGLASCSATIMPKDAVLLSSRAPIGLVALAAMPICTNQGFKSLVSRGEVDPWYLFAWCKLRRDYLESLGRGATFKEISKRIVETVKVPVPPMDAQRRFRSAVQDLRNQRLRAKEVRHRTGEIFAILLERAFSGSLTASWREAHMKELLQEMEQQAKALEAPSA